MDFLRLKINFFSLETGDPRTEFPTNGLSKDKRMKTNKEVPRSKGNTKLPHIFMDIFSFI